MFVSSKKIRGRSLSGSGQPWLTYSIIIGLLGCVFLSCQTGREFHYFRQGSNYYRVQVREWAFLSSSRYTSGYFDETALDNYFGQIHRSDSTGNLQALSLQKAGKDSNNVVPTNTKLVMILSTDASQVADQIAAFAQNEQTLDMLARLANKDVVKDNQQLQNTITQQTNTSTSIMQFGDSVVPKLQASAIGDTATIRAQLLSFLNYVAAMNGKTIPFKTWDDAYNWYIDEFSKK